MSLFKYLSSERLCFFGTLRLRYSQPASLNDPFEGRPFFQGFAPKKEMEFSYSKRFAKVLAEQYESMGIEFKCNVSFADFSAALEHNMEEIYEIFRTVDGDFVQSINATMHDAFASNIGLFSLSEIRDSQLMWSHYGESHKGFALEFDDSHPYFADRGVSADEIWQLHKVIYKPNRPQTTVVELNFQAILLSKHDSWSYEREWRDFRPLNLASETINMSPFPIHLFEFPPECIRSVIFGAKMTPALRDSAVAKIEANRKLAHLTLIDAVLDTREYGLQFRTAKPTTPSLADSCRGSS